MTANKIILLIIMSLVGMAAFGLAYDIKLLVILGHIFTLPMVGVWYGVKRQWNTTPIDKVMYLAYFVGSFSDSLILVGGEVGETLQLIMTFTMHTILIIAFRKEGTRIYSDKAKDLPKILIPIVIVFIFFGAVVMRILPVVIYFIAIFYAVQEMILVSHGLFREIRGKSYVWVAIGTSLIMVKDALYCYNFYIYKSSILPLYIIQYSLSAFVYLMIAVGMAYGFEDKDWEKEKASWQYIKNQLDLHSKTKRFNYFYKDFVHFTLQMLRKKQIS